MSGNLPVSIMKTPSKNLQENLHVIHTARAAFIAGVNDLKIKRAFLHNLRTSTEATYVTSDNVLYKRSDCSECRGPDIVIGQVSM